MDIERGEISVVRPRTGDYVERHEAYAGGEWTRWPVHWSGIWVGALAALATALVFGLVGTAVGAHQVGPARAIVRLTDVGLGALMLITRWIEPPAMREEPPAVTAASPTVTAKPEPATAPEEQQ